MSREELERLTKEELIELLLKQAELLVQLQAELEVLRVQLDKGRKPPTTSKNSSQPPSRDQKRSLPADRQRRKHGPPAGHPKHVRQFVACPDRVVTVRNATCPACQADLREQPGQLVAVNQITELPAIPTEVIEVRQYAQVCPQCGQQHVAQPPAGLEMGRRFGARLEATVVYYRQQQHLSYARTQQALHDLHGVSLSQGGIDQIMQRAGRQALPQAEQIRQRVCQSPVILSDETGSRVNGENWWQWVFCSLTAVLHVIRHDRSADVIKAVMGAHQAEVWVSDCLTSQLKAPARQHQLCLAHQLRALQAVVDLYPTAFWARAMQALLRYTIHLHHQRSQLPPAYFQEQVSRIQRLCTWLVGRSLSQPQASKLQRRYRKYRDCLFVFLYRTDVPPTNNLSERFLRPSVIHRKVIGCFRSEWGTQAYAALASVIDTAALAGKDAFQTILSLFGQPALPPPIACE